MSVRIAYLIRRDRMVRMQRESARKVPGVVSCMLVRFGYQGTRRCQNECKMEIRGKNECEESNRKNVVGHGMPLVNIRNTVTSYPEVGPVTPELAA